MIGIYVHRVIYGYKIKKIARLRTERERLKLFKYVINVNRNVSASQ